VSARSGVGKVNGDLAVLDAPCGAGVLTLNADRVHALLQIAGLVVVLQLPDDEAADVVTVRVGIPSGPRQQVLQTIRGRVPAYSASVQQFLRGRSDIDADTQVPVVVARGSDLASIIHEVRQQADGPSCRFGGWRGGVVRTLRFQPPPHRVK
jgi:hypothetical protein